MTAQQLSANDYEIDGIAQARTLAEMLLDEFIRSETQHWGETLPQIIMPLREAVRSDQVDGWVARQGDRPLGLVAYTAQAGNGRIHFIHILPDCEGQELAQQLLRRAVTDLRDKGAQRIAFENPIACHEQEVRQAFQQLGFQVIDRATMSLLMEESPAEPSLPADLELCPWDDRHLEGVIEVVHGANLGTLDELVYPGLGSISGTNRLVQTVLKGAAGPFDREASLIALHAGIPCGVVLFARPGSDQGFISEIAVAKARQGQGLGRILLCRALALAYARGIRTVRLGLTEQNRAAARLCRRAGFQTERRSTVYIWREGAAETAS